MLAEREALLAVEMVCDADAAAAAAAVLEEAADVAAVVVCLFGCCCWMVGGGCWRKAAMKEERKKGRCEGIVFECVCTRVRADQKAAQWSDFRYVGRVVGEIVFFSQGV